MKRYWLFGGLTYYPSGGMGDYQGSYDSLGDARADAERRKAFPYYEGQIEWYHVFDSEEKKLIEGTSGFSDPDNKWIRDQLDSVMCASSVADKQAGE